MTVLAEVQWEDFKAFFERVLTGPASAPKSLPGGNCVSCNTLTGYVSLAGHWQCANCGGLPPSASTSQPCQCGEVLLYPEPGAWLWRLGTRHVRTCFDDPGPPKLTDAQITEIWDEMKKSADHGPSAGRAGHPWREFVDLADLKAAIRKVETK